MKRIVEKDGNEFVTIMINGIETDYKFSVDYDLDDNTAQVLTNAGYEVEEVTE